VLPDFVDYKAIVRNNLPKNFGVEKMIKHFVHKSLTRIIFVIDEK